MTEATPSGESLATTTASAPAQLVGYQGAPPERLCPDTAAMPADDAFDDREARPGPLEVFLSVQALEHAEDRLSVLHVKTHAVVADVVHGRVAALATHLDDCGVAIARELHRVAQQINDDATEECRVALGVSEIVDPPLDAALARFGARGTLETRVLPSGRKFTTLGVSSPKEIQPLLPLDVEPRELIDSEP